MFFAESFPACCYSQLMLNLHRCVVWVVAVLLMSGAALAQTSTDPDESAELAALRVRANAGVAVAQLNLGNAYYNGRGVPQDYVEAVSWYRTAADQGVAGAQFYLGNAYYNGRGVPQDYVEAVSWYRAAADQGVAGAQFYLGNAYYNGRGVPQDYVEAHKWRNLAASRADVEDQKTFAERRDEVAKEMPLQQVAEAQKLAREWQAAFEQRGGK
jgi:TPR repeat protein